MCMRAHVRVRVCLKLKRLAFERKLNHSSRKPDLAKASQMLNVAFVSAGLG